MKERSIQIRTGSIYDKENRAYLLMALPAVILCFLIAYVPMFGAVLAFKAYDISKGIFSSPWIGFDNFKFFLTSQDFYRITRNTIVMNGMFIFGGLVCQVGLALMLNEIRNKWFTRITQSIMFLPNFMSWAVVGYFLFGFLSIEHGYVNKILEGLGMEPVMWYNEARQWPAIIFICYTWKNVGAGCIIYLAAMISISDEYYNAATIDGANKLQQVFHITLPSIMPLMVTLTLLAIGRILNSDFGMFYNLTRNSGALYETMDVLDSYVYRALRQNGDIGMASAAAFYQSIFGFIMIILTNSAVKLYDREYAIF